MPARYIFLDEVDAYPASADEEGDPADQREHAGTGVEVQQQPADLGQRLVPHLPIELWQQTDLVGRREELSRSAHLATREPPAQERAD